MKLIIFLFFLIFTNTANAEFIYPFDDNLKELKHDVIDEIIKVMPNNNPIYTINTAGKVILWANEAKILPKYIHDKKIFVNSSLPSFTALNINNKERLHKESQRLCKCKIDADNLGGILVASPLMAAKMFERQGWLDHKGTELIGVAPPIVIIFHELMHIKDYLTNPDIFFAGVGDLSLRWKNEAEAFASHAQNDFVQALQHRKKLNYVIRQSYGRNEYFEVSDMYATTLIN